jgi:ZIP family zinc transporter/zinc and cadmium transporter
MNNVFIQAVIAFLSALSGALIIFRMKMTHNRLCFLISLSAGALAGASAFTLIPEAGKELSLIQLPISVFSGYGLFWILNKYVFHICPACAASHFDEQTTKKFSEIAILLFSGLAFHSLLDGVALATNRSGEGNSIFWAVFTHKFPEGIALASLMIASNYKRAKILEYVFLVEITTIIGAFLGTHILPMINGVYIAWVEAHISGGFLFLAIHALVGEIFRNHKRLVALSFIAGAAVIFIIARIVS